MARGLPDHATEDVSKKQERKLRRLAVLLAAQLPEDPEQAAQILNYTMEHVFSWGAKRPERCPLRGSCTRFHSLRISPAAVAADRANEL